MFLSPRRAEEPANFLTASAPAPDFFSKRLRLRLQGAKNTRLRPAPDPQSWAQVLIYLFIDWLVAL